jgi:voltage-gated potassium channel
LVRSVLLVVLVFVLGTVGYTAIGAPDYGFLDAVYMTVITLTTVGYGEVIDLTDKPVGRVFTILLLVMGVGAVLNLMSTLTALFVDGSIQQMLWRRRMSKAIGKLSGHTIVCGSGYTGESIVRELVETRRPFVLVERDEKRVDHLFHLVGTEFPTVLGDATDDDTLEEAGIQRAGCVIACISNDNDNLVVTLSARILNPRVRIVSRCIDEDVSVKLRKAGANAVVSPTRIGGLRMVSEAIRPTAVSFLDRMLRDKERNLRVESAVVHPDSSLGSSTVGDLRRRGIEGLLVLALQSGEEEWTYAPRDDIPLRGGVRVVFMGGPETRATIEGLARPPR